MSYEPISLTHKTLLKDRLRSVSVPISEYSFPNLFLFRNTHHYEVFECDKELFVRGKTYDNKTYIMPTKDMRTCCLDTLHKLQGECDFFFPVHESWLEFFKDHDIEYDFRDGDTDYIYTTEKMSTYKGRKLHKKRNLLKQFNESYKAEAFEMSKDRLGDCKYILEKWLELSGLTKEDTDYFACCEALRLYDELCVCGGIYYIDGEPCGFVIGEELTDDTYVLHFAKALTTYKGIYQYLYNDFANILPKRYEFINFEQDLGKTALRMAKTSYIPDQLEKKYRMSFKKTDTL
ncbi:Uncharacterized conserved protein UCP018688 [Denitrovibrio acetiphilus DSM 12809]|uniref:Uncharacterized conserved protein UCP018688 n=1 Tax=Denitrovibrio acetiphilus (strain DSM 12809 / NBRC 114555 / N2460) TaxID=522772 RepID=D4H6I1_DENA2|nr:phosphatidylglycerol lysyltransferase domain-containing protein [Denitrovibrio acetiphilus]ADD69655.1 Uncharacterized conserved protein UCP018688 [Denitrovibrio acetiphilus DSM 12809]